jgi:transaldolase
MNEELLEHRRQLLFETPVDEFVGAATALRRQLNDEFARAPSERQVELVELLGELTVDLGSYLTRWHLLAPGRGVALDQGELDLQVAGNRELLGSWGAAHKGAADKLADVASELESIATSNLRKLSELTQSGKLQSRYAHDAATGLTWAIRRGAALVTTNPVMVNAVRKEDPATWDPVRDALKASHPDATAEQRVSLMTMSVVLEECREMRPIWQASDGRYGYVSLQVNPRANADAAQMADEVMDLFERLRVELGGTPNTVFKIPATHAGLDAVRRLTAAGIGVNVTVNASVDQHLAFGEVIEQGSAPLSFLVLMMGRLDDPVREELSAAGLPDAESVSRWASVAVLRRSYPLLYEERGYQRSAILAASMRGPWSIDGSIVSGPAEVFITCFPDKARDYDAIERPVADHLREPLPDGIEAKLMQSETFRQAYGPGTMAPEEFDSFAPVVQTLAQFSTNYDEFVDYNR